MKLHKPLAVLAAAALMLTGFAGAANAEEAPAKAETKISFTPRSTFNKVAPAAVTVTGVDGAALKGKSGSVTVTITDDADATKLKSASKTVSNGKANVSFRGKPLGVGKYTAKVVFTSTNPKFDGSEGVFSFEVTKATPKVSVSKKAVANGKIKVKVDVPGARTGAKFKVKVRDGKKTIGAKVVRDGKTVTITMPVLKNGTHKFTVKVVGANNQAKANVKATTKKLRVKI